MSAAPAAHLPIMSDVPRPQLEWSPLGCERVSGQPTATSEYQLDDKNKRGNKNNQRTLTRSPTGPSTARTTHMVRIARESLAFASVASFVWMMCAVAAHVS
ncbi:cell division inhibitor SidA [Phenylobacterium soli]